MRYNTKVAYTEEVRGQKINNFNALGFYEKHKDFVNFDIKISKKDNIQLRLDENNAIIYIDRSGIFNYKVCHQENEKSNIKIKINSDAINESISSEIKTTKVDILKSTDSFNIVIEFLRDGELIKSTYHFKLK